MKASAGKPGVLILVENLPVPLDRRVWQEAGAFDFCSRKTRGRRPCQSGALSQSIGSQPVCRVFIEHVVAYRFRAFVLGPRQDSKLDSARCLYFRPRA